MAINLSSADQRISNQQRCTDACYWIGIILTIACVALICARNTDWGWAFEHARFPLSWAAGLIAIVAFLASEYLHPDTPAPEPRTQILPETCTWATEFADV
jgi:hypothetical protein